MTENVFFDLDGTLIDPRKRLYDLFSELLPQSRFSFDEYWQLKRARIDQKQLLTEYFSFTEEDVVAFRREWMAKVEDVFRVQSDTPFPYVEKLLSKLYDRYNLFVVTARQKPELVFKQIESFDWAKYFKDIYVTRQNMTKHDIVRNNVAVTPHDCFIGDTGEDILSGKHLGVKTIAVASGFLNKEVLSEYKPDMIFESVKEIYENDTIWS
jgi:phosphoglycolate phosphatase